MPPLPRPTGLPLPGRLAAMLPPRMIMYVRASTEGAGIRRSAFMFNGRSVSRLRNKLARRLGAVMDVSNLAMCVQAGTHGRLTPLVVDLPRSGQDLHIVVFAAGTPVHMELRYPDVNGELVERYHQIHRSESTMDASGEHGIAKRGTRGMAGRMRGGIISLTGSLGAGLCLPARRNGQICRWMLYRGSSEMTPCVMLIACAPLCSTGTGAIAALAWRRWLTWPICLGSFYHLQ